MTKCVIRRHLLFLPVLLAAILLVSCESGQSPASDSGEAEEHTFAGRTITVVIGLDASAGGTTVGRLLANTSSKIWPVTQPSSSITCQARQR